MLEPFLKKLSHELQLEEEVKKNGDGSFEFSLGKISPVLAQPLNPGVCFSTIICPCPQQRREDLFILLMRANLLGQGTGGSRIGLKNDEKTLTLQLVLPYELDYQNFRNCLEDFINYAIYWHEEIVKFETTCRLIS